MTSMSEHAERAEIDSAVMRRARRGDERAFAAVIRHYDPACERSRTAYSATALAWTMRSRRRTSARFGLCRGFGRVGTRNVAVPDRHNACLDELRRTRQVIPLDSVRERPDPRPGAAETFGPEAIWPRHSRSSRRRTGRP